MSGDVTAAIERLRGDVSDKGVLTKDWPSIARDTRTLLAEVERLRAEVDGWIKTGLNTKWDRDNYAATAQRLRDENARLRAEREAPNSDETREAVAWALIDNDTDVADRGVREEHYQERVDDARIAINAVLSVLAAGSEAAQ